MVAGKPVAVQSPARTRFVHAVFGRGRLAFCSGVAAKVARRSRTICHGGSGASRPRDACHFAPDQSASSSRGVSSSRSAPLMVTESRSGKAKIHSTVPLITPISGGKPLRRRNVEMRVDDGAELGRRRQAGDQRRRHRWRHGKNDGVLRLQRDCVLAEIERFRPSPRQISMPRSRCAEPHVRLAPIEKVPGPGR